MKYHLEIEIDEKRRKKVVGEYDQTYDDLSTAENAMFQVAADHAGYGEGCVYVIDEKGKIITGNSWS